MNITNHFFYRKKNILVMLIISTFFISGCTQKITNVDPSYNEITKKIVIMIINKKYIDIFNHLELKSIKFSMPTISENPKYESVDDFTKNELFMFFFDIKDKRNHFFVPAGVQSLINIIENKKNKFIEHYDIVKDYITVNNVSYNKSEIYIDADDTRYKFIIYNNKNNFYIAEYSISLLNEK